MNRRLLLKKLMLAPLAFLVPGAVVAYGGYCDGYRDGHKSYYRADGGGYPGYPGCPGDPGGNGSAYERGFRDGMMKASRERR
jgi:hypothetical protein